MTPYHMSVPKVLRGRSQLARSTLGTLRQRVLLRKQQAESQFSDFANFSLFQKNRVIFDVTAVRKDSVVELSHSCI